MASAFRCTLREYDASSAFEKIGHLIAASAAGGHASMYLRQADAWQAELAYLADTAAYLSDVFPPSQAWSLLIEFEIPRRAKRPDAILLADDLIFVVEFKIRADSFLSADIWQVKSYALDLRDFHRESQNRRLIPMLIATNAQPSNGRALDSTRQVQAVQRVGSANGTEFAKAVLNAFKVLHDSSP